MPFSFSLVIFDLYAVLLAEAAVIVKFTNEYSESQSDLTDAGDCV